ncbi:hypothetical protein PRIPAC_79334 [Pristionchus pacificus]|uniref:Serpentine receptor class gamma n=1 Tax=Pristionchus pacificus TaxID=54126 RepID=A0A2A6CBI2_PRIPA|nr:hypothetical protein PRIPAC_79334 [Pristionchus pacificus]|eukprot:PDM75460.1 G protein-coupled receptor [Pristionchus pacificus]
METFNMIFLIYGIPSCVLYFLVIATVISMRKNFSSSFNTIFLMTAVVNLGTWFNTWLTLRLTVEPFFFWYYYWVMTPEIEWFRNIQQFLVSYFYFAQNACAFLFTINRFTAICMPSQHQVVRYCSQTLWTTWKWPFILVIHLISLSIPLATRWPAIVTYVYDQNTNSFTQKRGSTINVLTAMICYGSVVMAICIAANVYAVYCLLKFRATTKTSKNELSFTLISFSIFLAQTMNISIVILSAIFVYTANGAGSAFLSTITPYTSDIFSLGPPVYTMIVPGPIRNRMRSVVRKTLHLQNSSSSVSKIVTTIPSR